MNLRKDAAAVSVTGTHTGAAKPPTLALLPAPGLSSLRAWRVSIFKPYTPQTLAREGGPDICKLTSPLSSHVSPKAWLPHPESGCDLCPIEWLGVAKHRSMSVMKALLLTRALGNRALGLICHQIFLDGARQMV